MPAVGHTSSQAPAGAKKRTRNSSTSLSSGVSAGVVVTGLGAVLIVWGFFSLGDALTPFPRPLDGAVLHRQGAFRLMRHPIYTGVILASLGWTGWWLSGIGLLPVLALAIFFDRKAAHEEAWLREKYRDYDDYARRVKKFIPGVY